MLTQHSAVIKRPPLLTPEERQAANKVMRAAANTWRDGNEDYIVLAHKLNEAAARALKILRDAKVKT